MTGKIFVKRLNHAGFHISELDTDKCFASSNNPDGYFRMIVVPFFDPDMPFIKYEKAKSGYWVEGEGYIVSGSKEEIGKKARYYRRRYTPGGKVEFRQILKENDKLYSKQKDGTITRWYVYAVSGDDFAVSPVPNAKLHHYKRYYKKGDIGVSIFLTRHEAKQSEGRCYTHRRS